ncbi:hypothetical protein [Vulcanococcus sp.]|uniref:hypothetical protein n=1 Tax=Vulcanococcus sp. TaxID=2856995 RepID=UPI003F6A0CC9
MATTLPTLSPLWRNSLRTWLAACLAIGVMQWAGRGQVLVLALAMTVVFINENDLVPARTIREQLAGALIGILTAVVVHEISRGWLVLAIGLLITGGLTRGLGLAKGVGMGYISCWSLEVIGYGKHFNWALIFDLTFAVVVGIIAAQIATWVFWPRRQLQQLPALELRLCDQLSRQINQLRQWLDQGGSPPPPLRSQELLPQILVLQQLHDQRQNSPTPIQARRLIGRWAQTGSIWRQLLRQWLLLEPLLLQLPAPLGSADLLQSNLQSLELALQRQSTSQAAVPLPSPTHWLAEAKRLNTAPPLLLAIGQQIEQLHRLLHSHQLVQQAIAAQASPTA